MKYLLLTLIALFLVGCAGNGYNPSGVHPDAWEAARGPGTESPDAGDSEGGEGGEGDAP